jgi:hypothetical protein
MHLNRVLKARKLCTISKPLYGQIINDQDDFTH